MRVRTEEKRVKVPRKMTQRERESKKDERKSGAIFFPPFHYKV